MAAAWASPSGAWLGAHRAQQDGALHGQLARPRVRRHRGRPGREHPARDRHAPPGYPTSDAIPTSYERLTIKCHNYRLCRRAETVAGSVDAKTTRPHEILMLP
ncbi:hypothetical protein Raf01_83230 [Rugosimonospora africana]|uniref:Uncharacterized protein n=1 Tax=Rugosimonospora africana TaxID=556532 RepID=A0A8J3R504_9ACTN|nr:hypothetical protein Raf01_83230 [Rugosimonospora africana]